MPNVFDQFDDEKAKAGNVFDQFDASTGDAPNVFDQFGAGSQERQEAPAAPPKPTRLETAMQAARQRVAQDEPYRQVPAAQPSQTQLLKQAAKAESQGLELPADFKLTPTLDRTAQDTLPRQQPAKPMSVYEQAVAMTKQRLPSFDDEGDEYKDAEVFQSLRNLGLSEDQALDLQSAIKSSAAKSLALMFSGGVTRTLGAAAKLVENIPATLSPAAPLLQKFEVGERLLRATEAAQRAGVRPDIRESLVGQVAAGLGSTVPFLATGGAGAWAGLGGKATLGLTAAFGSAVGGGEGLRTAEQVGANPKETLLRTLGGMVTGSLEALPINRAINRLDKGTGGAFSRALKNRIGRPLVEAFWGAAEEAIQEAIQAKGDQWLDKQILGIERDGGIAGEAGVGGIVGFLLSGLAGIMRVRTARSHLRKMGYSDEYIGQMQPSEQDDLLTQYAEAQQRSALTQPEPKAAQEPSPGVVEEVIAPPPAAEPPATELVQKPQLLAEQAKPPTEGAPDAESIRVDKGPAVERGVAPPRGKDAGKQDIQRPAEKRPEARKPVVPKEDVGTVDISQPGDAYEASAQNIGKRIAQKHGYTGVEQREVLFTQALSSLAPNDIRRDQARQRMENGYWGSVAATEQQILDEVADNNISVPKAYKLAKRQGIVIEKKRLSSAQGTSEAAIERVAEETTKAKRRGEQAEAREVMAVKQAEAATQALLDSGGKIDYESPSGSVYVKMPDGGIIRIADHAVPETGERRYNAEQRGTESPWDEDLVFSGRGNEASAIERAKEIIAEQPASSFTPGDKVTYKGLPATILKVGPKRIAIQQGTGKGRYVSPASLERAEAPVAEPVAKPDVATKTTPEKAVEGKQVKAPVAALPNRGDILVDNKTAISFTVGQAVKSRGGKLAYVEAVDRRGNKVRIQADDLGTRYRPGGPKQPAPPKTIKFIAETSKSTSGRTIPGITIASASGDVVVESEDIGNSTLQVYNASVEESIRRKGYATQAYTRLLEEAKKQGYKTVVSDSSVSANASSIWKRLGAKKTTTQTQSKPRPNQTSLQESTIDKSPLYQIDLYTPQRTTGDKLASDMTKNEFIAKRPAVEGYIYHGSPEGDIDNPDSAYSYAPRREGAGFYTTESREQAADYAQGQTASGNRKAQARKAGRVNYVKVNSDANLLDMDAPYDRELWDKVASTLDVDYTASEKRAPFDEGTNGAAFRDIALQYSDNTSVSPDEALDALAEIIEGLGYNGTTHMEGRARQPHRVRVLYSIGFIDKTGKTGTSAKFRVVPAGEVYDTLTEPTPRRTTGTTAKEPTAKAGVSERGALKKPRTPVKFSIADINRRLAAWYNEGPGADAQTMEDVASETVASGEATMAFPGKLPSEITDHFENMPHILGAFRTNQPNGRGADAISKMGPDAYFAMVERAAGGQQQVIDKAMELGRGAPDPEIQFLVWLRDKIEDTRTAVEVTSGKRKGKYTDKLLPTQKELITPDALPVGSTFKIEGDKFTVEMDEFNSKMLRDGIDLPAWALEQIPIDKGTLKRGKPKPQKPTAQTKTSGPQLGLPGVGPKGAFDAGATGKKTGDLFVVPGESQLDKADREFRKGQTPKDTVTAEMFSRYQLLNAKGEQVSEHATQAAADGAKARLGEPGATVKPVGAAKPSVLDKLEQDALARIKERKIPRGRDVGATTLLPDLVDATIVVAARATRLGIRGGQALAQLVQQVVKTDFPHLSVSQVLRKSKRLIADSEVGGTINQDKFELAANLLLSRAKGSDQRLAAESKAVYPPLQKEMVDPRKKPDAINDLDRWHGDRDVSAAKADIRTRKHKEQLRKAVGRRSISKVLTESARGESRTKEAAAAEAIHLYIDLKNAESAGNGSPQEQLDKWSTPNKEKGVMGLSNRQKAVFNLSQRLPTPLLAIADEIIKENKQIGIEGVVGGAIFRNVKDAQSALASLVDNYSARIWQQPKEGDLAKLKKLANRVGFAKFTTRTPRSKQRSLESILHGWSLGKQLAVPGAIQAQNVAEKQVAQVIHDRKLIETAAKAGVITDKREPGLVLIQHPNFTKWAWAGRVGDLTIDDRKALLLGHGVRMVSREEATTPAEVGAVYREVPLYAEPRLAKHLNNIFRRSVLYEIPGVETLTKYNDLLKAQVLFTSLFHHQAFLRSFMLASPGIDPVKAYIEGGKAINAFGPDLQELVRGGLTLGLRQDFQDAMIHEKTIVGKVIDKLPVGREIKNMFFALRDQQIDFLFDRLGPQLKAQAALLELHHQLRKNRRRIESGKTTRKEIAEAVAEELNNDFGGLNLERKARNPEMQHIFRLLALAPDWTESNVRMMVDAFRTGEKGAVARGMWARLMVRGLGATMIANFLLAAMPGDDDEPNVGRRFVANYQRAWAEGKLRWLDVDVTPIYRGLGGKTEKRKYFSLIGHFRDPAKFVVHPIRSAKHKSSILGRTVGEAITGTDWAGRRFTTYEELLGIDDKGVYKTTRKGRYQKGTPKGGKLTGQTVVWDFRSGGPVDYNQLPSFLISQGGSFMPIQVQQLMAWTAGEQDAFDTLTHSVGLMTSTTYEKKSPK